ncbi:hypothetical protein M1N80_03475 [Peptococcaceae bacterium]|nr:hypothetical protein [Peptococcaceae bacterium]MCL0100850.1 hypothetical protein [Peptococcaceae bacterium]
MFSNRDGIPDVPVEEGGPDVFVKVIKPSIWRFPGAFLENYIPTRAVVRMGPVSEADYDNAYKAYKTLGKDYWHLVRWTNSWNRYEKIVGRYYPAEWKVGHVRNRFDSKGTQHS